MEKKLILEVEHIGEDMVRCAAMDATDVGWAKDTKR